MKQLIIFCSLCLLLCSACHRRELCEAEIEQLSKLEIYLDWSELEQAQGEMPSGVSALFYAKNGAEPVSLRSTNIDTLRLNLQAGEYDVLIFNQIPSDFAALKFEGLEAFDTAKVSTNAEKTSDDEDAWYAGQAVQEPEYLAAATVQSFEVLPASATTKTENIFTQSLSLKPWLVVRRVKILAHVSGTENIEQVQAYVEGLAQSHNFALARSDEKSVSHTLEQGWSIDDATRSSSTKAISTIFLSFGAPEDDYSTSAKPMDVGKVGLNVLLKDKQTKVETGDLDLKSLTSTAEDDASHDLLIQINEQSDPIYLPDVSSPSTDSEGGFDVDIEGWDDIQQVIVPMF